MRNSKLIQKAGTLFLTLSLMASVCPIAAKATENNSVANPSTQKNVTISGSDNATGKLNNPLVKASTTTWNSVTFGNYWKTGANQDGKQPIQWRVLSVNGDDMYLLSEQNLDVQQYNDKAQNESGLRVEWQDCSLNKGLNETFLNEAFSDVEQTAIIGTTEKVSLLSEQEIKDKKYEFSSNKACKTEGTAYAHQSLGNEDNEIKDSWWTKTTEGNAFGKCVDSSGRVISKNITLKAGIRPVIHLKKTSDLWKNSEKIVMYNDFNSQWDCVYFGNYYQNDAKKKQPIKWRVLSVNGDDVFMISNRSLDYQKYSENLSENSNDVWEKSSLRSWLNTTFFKEAFNATEQAAIKNSSETNDKLFLLSATEMSVMSYGLGGDMAAARPTEYAKSRGATSYDMKGSRNYGFGAWMLRDMVNAGGETVIRCVSPFGDVGACDGELAVRPGLRISISSGAWTSAGKLAGLDDGSIDQYSESITKNNQNASKVTVTAPLKVNLSTVKNAKGKKINVKWKKVKGAKGYQLQYALNKKFKKKKSIQTKKTKYTIKKLKKKKTYYIRVRAYKMNGKKKVYGKWSKVKKVKIKK